MKSIVFKNALRLGDCFWHCMYMRSLVKHEPDVSVTLHCQPSHHVELKAVVKDLPNIHLEPIQTAPPNAIECWIGRAYKGQGDIIEFLVWWFQYLADQESVPNYIKTRKDMLADYPTLFNPDTSMKYDFLVINACPQSNQFDYSHVAMDEFIDWLRQRFSIITSNPNSLGVPCVNSTITDIGRVSQQSRSVIGSATGPIWPSFNIWNVHRFDQYNILLRNHWVDYGSKMPTFRYLKDCVEHFKSRES